MSWRGRSRRALPYLLTAGGAFLIGYLIVFFFVFPTGLVPDDAELPNVVGLYHDDAVRRLRLGGFEATRGEDGLIAEAAVTAESAPTVDRAAVMERIAGRDEAEAEAALADVGVADVELWPGWVTSVPTVEWRVEVRIGSAEPTSRPAPT